MKSKWRLAGFLWLIFALGATAQYEKISVLVYTSPDLYHNPSVPTAVSEFRKMAVKNFMDFRWTQQESVFCDSILDTYSVVVFLHANDSRLSTAQLECFRNYIRNGNGFVGIHAASVGGGEWFKKLVGRTFERHPEKQTGVMHVLDKTFPATFHLPDRWIWTDEWYEFGDAHTDKLQDILSVSELSYVVEVGMGPYHPVAWYQEFEGGRSFYTALGHMSEAFTDKYFLDHMLGGIYWAATGKGMAE